MHWRTKGLFALIPMLLLMLGIPILAQQNTGNITGKVLDDQNQPIPGATVTATSPNLQGPRGTATNMDGDFVLPYLPPAANYTLTVESSGYNKVVQSGIVVKLGSTTTLNFTLGKGSSQVVVTAKPPAVSLKDNKIEANITSEELDTLPISRSYQNTMYLAPTVVASGMGGNPGVAGSTGSENIWMINGVNTTDPVTGTFGTNLNYNFIREVEVNTGGLGAEYGASTGGLFNVLTKSGSNEFHGEAYAYYTDASMSAQGDPVFGGGIQPTDSHSYDYGFDVGGPIIKDKLWYFVGYNPSLHSTHYQGSMQLQSYNYAGLTYDVPYKFDDISRNWFWSGKFNYRINDKHNLEFAAFGDPSHMWYNEGPLPTIDDRALHTRRYQGGYNTILRWYATWTPNFFMETAFGKTHSRLDILPWDNAGYGAPEIVSLDWSPSVGVGAGSGTILWDDRDSTQFQSKATWVLGNHEVKFGVQAEDLKWNSYDNYTGGQFYYVWNNFGPGPTYPSPNLNDYDVWDIQSLQNPRSYEKGKYYAAFVQDKWSLTDYMTLTGGVRFERNKVEPQNGQSLSIDSWSPRVGLTWDFMHNGKSKFYVHYGQYSERIPIAMAQSMDPGHASYEDLILFGYLPYAHYVYGAIPTGVLGSPKDQYTEEYLAGIEYEIRPDFTIGARVQYRSLGRVLEDVGYVDSTGNIDYIIMNPGSGQWPAQLMSNWQYAVPDYAQFPHPTRIYRALTLTARKRFSNHWWLDASYTLSRLEGNYEGGSGGYSTAGLNPNASSAYDVPEWLLIQNTYGLLPQDRTHIVKIQSGYKFDFGLVLGATFDLQSGRPVNKLYGYPRYEAGYGTVFAVPRGEAGRMPTTWTLDAHIEYQFKLWKTDLSLIADVFNVTNEQRATGVYQTYYSTPSYLSDITSGNLTKDPNWGKVTARQAPRYVRVGIKWTF